MAFSQCVSTSYPGSYLRPPFPMFQNGRLGQRQRSIGKSDGPDEENVRWRGWWDEENHSQGLDRVTWETSCWLDDIKCLVHDAYLGNTNTFRRIIFIVCRFNETRFILLRHLLTYNWCVHLWLKKSNAKYLIIIKNLAMLMFLGRPEVQILAQNTAAFAEYYLHWTTTFEISFSGSSDTNHDSLL